MARERRSPIRLLSHEEITALVASHAGDIAQDFVRAGDLARALKQAKSTHPWTVEECSLLAELCAALGVSDDEKKGVP